jgi:hypothetical protein
MIISVPIKAFSETSMATFIQLSHSNLNGFQLRPIAVNMNPNSISKGC